MVQKLIVLQSLWAMERRQPDGIEPGLDEKLETIILAGFDGVSSDWRDRAKSRRIAEALCPYNLAAEGTCFPRSVDDLLPVLDIGTETGLHHLNIQADIRPERLSESLALLEGWMRLAEQVAFPVYFETHRGRLTTDLPFTLDLLERLPDMKLLADLSHYVVGQEIVLPVSPEAEARIMRILERSWAFHGRIATPEQVQVEIGFPQHQPYVEMFCRWWEAGMASWAARSGSDDSLAFTCELGPQPYAISGPDGRDLGDRWSDSIRLRDLARSLWTSAKTKLPKA